MDRVDAAVKAVETPPQPNFRMTVIEGAFGDSGRPFGVSVPEDISEAEAYALIELITKVRQQAFVNAPKRPRLFVPG